jgi:hypothetical protein
MKIKYQEIQRQKQINFFNALHAKAQSKEFDSGGVYKKRPREFVLKNPEINLHQTIRQSAIDYFNEYGIAWWDGGLEKKQTGHMLSSQVACVNHLYPLRFNNKLASAFLKRCSPDLIKALPFPKEDGGFIVFEKSSENCLLGEKGNKRGAHSTSIDAMMLAENRSGKRLLVLIEWKYTEHYGAIQNRYTSEGTDRLERYLSKLPPNPSQIKTPAAVQAGTKVSQNLPKLDCFGYEPYYQLMRQSLLGEQMVSENDFDYKAEDYVHLHLISRDNYELLGPVSKRHPFYFCGDDLKTRWQSCLNVPDRYKLIFHDQIFPGFAEGLVLNSAEKEWLDYLEARYL